MWGMNMKELKAYLHIKKHYILLPFGRLHFSSKGQKVSCMSVKYGLYCKISLTDSLLHKWFSAMISFIGAVCYFKGSFMAAIWWTFLSISWVVLKCCIWFCFFAGFGLFFGQLPEDGVINYSSLPLLFCSLLRFLQFWWREMNGPPVCCICIS